jgi:hypothetical protein
MTNLPRPLRISNFLHAFSKWVNSNYPYDLVAATVEAGETVRWSHAKTVALVIVSANYYILIVVKMVD